VLAPCELYLAGRATDRYRGAEVPVAELAQTAARQWLAAHLHAFDAQRHVRIHCRTRCGSSDLVELFARQQRAGARLANDTSLGVGFAPPSLLERVVSEVEGALTAPATKRAYPALGDDVKVLGVRLRQEIELSIACAVVDGYVANLDEYLAARRAAGDLALAAARRVCNAPVSVHVNQADDVAAGSLYLTVTGTSAEAGDDGQVGRGNRPNGLITPYRPMVMEAAAGKNAVTHVGKLYNVLARDLAETLVRELPPVTAAECCLASQIGRPVHDPRVADIRLRVVARADIQTLRGPVEAIAQDVLSRADRLWERQLAGSLNLF
jgi:S-adenosylmethionine synthetase